jgi:hypothetical protein
MDAVQQFAQKLGIAVPKTFFVGGASKVNRLLNFSSSPNRVLFCKF